VEVVHPEDATVPLRPAAGGYFVGAIVLGDALGALSVAVAWVVFYPIAFGLLGYLVVKTIDLPLRRYGAESWPIVGCAAIAWAVGYGAQQLCGDQMAPSIRTVLTAGTATGAMLLILDKWQQVSLRTMKAALAGSPSEPSAAPSSPRDSTPTD